ncbi:integral membrane sensor domain MASE1 [Cryobacterium mesophilum]|uniref:Uncharacterized protein n=1 Tax=Terrimesophilobacter mesophilus TaxID=433647 RepID=A0A4V3I9S1_9MICO|nr:hypothetical protein [Terrimesophilobacter mesophilus]MBB5633861.1 integral membrane sensor domain MASE1 [Terrimesophilobacter mesophilus]TFB80538.1 hypothetical protein E3N84_11125 [Terrimesophilobacter mesophilus]
MELLFVVMGAILIGLVPRYLLPGRATYGSALLPAISATVASVVWAALTWAGWPFDGGWIWWVSLGAGGLAALVTPLLIATRRRHHDEALFERLSRP